MFKPLLIVLTALFLVACESTELHRDFDPNRDFGRYSTWRWNSPRLQYQPDDPRLRSDLTEERVVDAVAGQLEQHGLRPAPKDANADLKVSTWVIVDRRLIQEPDDGPYWGGYRRHYWGGPFYSGYHTVEYKVAILQIDLYDGRDGKLVWRGSGEQVLNDAQPTPAERATAIRQAVSKVLSQYPPH